MTTPAKRPMGADQARATIDAIKGAVEDIRTLVLDLHERDGWKALGYESWESCVAAEFGASRSGLYRNLQAALVERDLRDLGHISGGLSKNLDGSDKHIPESHLVPLAQLPTAENRGEAWAEAKEAAPKGKVTAKVVQDVVDRKLGKSRVNGVLTDDPPEIAKARAKGQIPKDTVPDVREPDPEPDAEPEPEPEEPTDEEWLESLPLSQKLTGSSLKKFHADARLYRTVEPARGTFKHHATRALNVARKRASSGAYRDKLTWFLRVEDPSRWLLCPTPENGGCSGAGAIPLLGDCPKCKGRGYWVQ